MLHSAPSVAPHPSPGVLSTLLVNNTPGLAIRRAIGVPCIIEEARSRPFRSPFTSAVYRAAPTRAAGAESARGPRGDSHRARPAAQGRPWQAPV